MADLGSTLRVSGKSTIEKASGGSSSDMVTSDKLESKFISDVTSFLITSVDSGSLNLGDTTPTTSTTYFVMRGRDIDCVGVVYRFWTVTNNPDTTGASYVGVKCGLSSLTDIIVAFKYVQ